MKKFLVTVNKGKGLYMFIRAQISAQIATIIDFILSILLNQVFGIYYLYATITGSVTGGIFNCVVNYKWTFRTEDCKPAYVFFKYILVWIGSIGLNSGGTFVLTEFLKRENNLINLSDSTAFITSTIIISVIVAVLWNYNLHRIFVFKNSHLNNLIKNKINKITNRHGNKKTSKKDTRRIPTIDL